LIARKITFLSDSFEFNGEPTVEKHPPPPPPPPPPKLFPTRALTDDFTNEEDEVGDSSKYTIWRNVLFGVAH